MADIVLRGGEIINGEGHPAVSGDVVVDGGTIVSTSSQSTTEANLEFDVQGKIVCPGFIDIHSHSDFSLMADRRNEGAIRQGITTLVTGNCGHGPAPLNNLDLAKRNTVGFSESWGVDFSWTSFNEYLEALLSPGLSANVAPLIPHGSVRLAAMGHSTAEASSRDLENMKSMVQEAMCAGAIGLSSGLEYSPGMYADEDELTALASVAAKYSGIYASHIRNRGELFEDAVEEAINICRRSDLPGQLSHLAPRPYAPEGAFESVLKTVNLAREVEGMQLGIDTFPDVWGPGMVVALLPPWVYEGDRSEVLNRLADPQTIENCRDHFYDPTNYLLRLGGLEMFYLSSSIAHPELVGKNFIEIGEAFGCDPVEGIFKLVLADGADFYNVMLRHIFATSDDLDLLLSDPYCSVESDGVVTATDGALSNFTMNRSSFCYTIRFLNEYVFKREIFSLEEAIRKMTSLPADSAGLSKRGRVASGMAADLVVLDPDKLSDKSTDNEPRAYPSGIEIVIVNGRLVLNNGQRTENLPGRLATQ